MSAFKRILVPVDFTRHSDEALRVATDMARRYHASLTLVHVLDPLDYAVAEYESEPNERRRAALSEIDKGLDAAKRQAESSGIGNVRVQSIEGGVSDGIVDFARRTDCDLIVMGTHGRTGIKRAMLGSVAEAVVRRAECPVLTVKAEKGTEAERQAGALSSAS